MSRQGDNKGGGGKGGGGGRVDDGLGSGEPLDRMEVLHEQAGNLLRRVVNNAPFGSENMATAVLNTSKESGQPVENVLRKIQAKEAWYGSAQKQQNTLASSVNAVLLKTRQILRPEDAIIVEKLKRAGVDNFQAGTILECLQRHRWVKKYQAGNCRTLSMYALVEVLDDDSMNVGVHFLSGDSNNVDHALIAMGEVPKKVKPSAKIFPIIRMGPFCLLVDSWIHCKFLPKDADKYWAAMKGLGYARGALAKSNRPAKSKDYKFQCLCSLSPQRNPKKYPEQYQQVSAIVKWAVAEEKKRRVVLGGKMLIGEASLKGLRMAKIQLADFLQKNGSDIQLVDTLRKCPITADASSLIYLADVLVKAGSVGKIFGDSDLLRQFMRQVREGDLPSEAKGEAVSFLSKALVIVNMNYAIQDYDRLGHSDGMSDQLRQLRDEYQQVAFSDKAGSAEEAAARHEAFVKTMPIELARNYDQSVRHIENNISSPDHGPAPAP